MTTVMRIICIITLLQAFWEQLFPYVGTSYSPIWEQLFPLIWETLRPLYILQEEAGYDNCDEDHHHTADFTNVLGILIPLFWDQLFPYLEICSYSPYLGNTVSPVYTVGGSGL